MSLKSMDVTHLPFCKQVLMLSGVSILYFSEFRYLFSGLRSSIGLHSLFCNQNKSVEESPRCLILDLFYCILLCM